MLMRLKIIGFVLLILGFSSCMNDMKLITNRLNGDFYQNIQTDSKPIQMVARIRPVRKPDKKEAWIYMEQALVGSDLERPPYRKRLYHLVNEVVGVKKMIACRIYEFPEETEPQININNLSLINSQVQSQAIPVFDCVYYFNVNGDKISGQLGKEGYCLVDDGQTSQINNQDISILENYIRSEDQGFRLDRTQIWGVERTAVFHQSKE